MKPALPHISSEKTSICICVRKRPLFPKEMKQGEIDSVSCANPYITIHEPKVKVDGITKYIQDHQFIFDNTFSHQEESHDIYQHQIKGLIPSIFSKGIVTLFAYGQTGSGKTYTVTANTHDSVKELFALVPIGMTFYMSFYEIYDGKVRDLLNSKEVCPVQEDGKGKIQITGLTERPAMSEKEMTDIIDFGHGERTTQATVQNDVSSRSHAICQIVVKDDQTDKP